MTTVPPANSTPLGIPFDHDRHDAGDDDDQGERDGVPAPAEKVEVGVFEDVHDRSFQLSVSVTGVQRREDSRAERVRFQILSVAT